MIKTRTAQFIAHARSSSSVFGKAAAAAIVDSPIGTYVDPDKLHLALEAAGLVVEYAVGERGVRVTVCPPCPPGKSKGWGLLAIATTIGSGRDSLGFLKGEALSQAVAARLVEEAIADGQNPEITGALVP